MEWLKTIIEKHTTDGNTDIEAVMNAVNTEFPKHAVTKAVYKEQSEKLKNATDTLEKLQAEHAGNEALQQSIEDYKKQLEEAERQRAIDRKEAFIELGLTKAGVRNSKAAKALLDLDKITESESGFEGFDDQLKALQESDAYLFNIAEDKPEPTPQITTTGNPAADDSGSTLSDEDKALYAGFDSV